MARYRVLREMAFAGGEPGTTVTLAEGAVVVSETSDLPPDVRRSLSRSADPAVAFLWDGQYRIGVVGQDVAAVSRARRGT